MRGEILKNRFSFFYISILVFSYKLSLGWRFNISHGSQDETDWFRLANNSNLFKTASTLDAGYPTPILRITSWFFAKYLNSSFTLLHIFNLVVISICAASILFLKNGTLRTKISLILVITSYPSFDLLLYHNLSYWIFIPCLVILINMTNSNLKSVPIPHSILFILLITTLSKPQLIVCILLFFIYFIIQRKNILLSFSSIIVITFFFISGRLNKSSLTLAFDWQSLAYFGFTWPTHFLITLTPVLVLIFNFIGKILNSKYLMILYWVIYASLSYIFLYSLLRKKESEILLKLLFSSYLICLLSLYLFPNSGWSRNDLITSHPYLELFTRHYLPLVILVFFILNFTISNLAKFSFVLYLVTIQNIIMQVLFFQKLYHPS